MSRPGCAPTPERAPLRGRYLMWSLLLLVPALLGAADAGAQEQRVFVLPAARGPALLQQCSRDTPREVEGFWTPGATDIAALEALLVPYLTGRRSGRPLLPLEQYHRQYVGFTKGAKHYIYGNFYALP